MVKLIETCLHIFLQNDSKKGQFQWEWKGKKEYHVDFTEDIATVKVKIDFHIVQVSHTALALQYRSTRSWIEGVSIRYCKSKPKHEFWINKSPDQLKKNARTWKVIKENIQEGLKIF